MGSNKNSEIPNISEDVTDQVNEPRSALSILRVVNWCQELYRRTDWQIFGSNLWITLRIIFFCATIYLWFSNTGGGDAWLLWIGLWLFSFALLVFDTDGSDNTNFFVFLLFVGGLCFSVSSVVNMKEETKCEAFAYREETWVPRSQKFPISLKSPFLRVKEVNFTTRTLGDVFDAITQDGRFAQARFRIEYAYKTERGDEIIKADYPCYDADSFKQPAQDLFRQLAVKYSSAEIAEKRLELEEKFLEAAKQHFEKHYIEVSSFGISGITFREVQ